MSGGAQPGPRSSPAAALFFAGPLLLMALAVALRASGEVDGTENVTSRVLTHVGHARAAAVATGVPTELLLAMAHVESGGHTRARSSKGAVGVMQILDGTAAEVADPGPVDLTDPATSFLLGARYLREHLVRYREHPCGRELALAAYNAGPGRVSTWLRDDPLPAGLETLGDWIPFRETRAYVPRVLGWERWYRERLAATTTRP